MLRVFLDLVGLLAPLALLVFMVLLAPLVLVYLVALSAPLVQLVLLDLPDLLVHQGLVLITLQMGIMI